MERFQAFCTNKRKTHCGWVVILLGIGFVLISVFVPPSIDAALSSGLNDALIIKESDYQDNTDTWQSWSDSTSSNSFSPDYLVYIFNITNPEGILNGEPAQVTEHGPYYYTQKTLRFNVSWTTDEHLRKVVQYKEWVRFEFNRQKTDPSLSESDVYTMLYGAFFEAASALSRYPLSDMLYELFPTEAHNSSHKSFTDLTRLFSTRNVSEALWGYYDSQLEEASELFGSYYAGILGPNITSMAECNENTYTFPSQCFFNKMFTGENDPDMMYQYYEWENMSSLTVAPYPVASTLYEPLWETPLSNAIFGTAGTSFHMGVDKDETLIAWIPEIFRRVSLYNLDYITYNVEGIKLLKFQLNNTGLDNSTSNVFNAPYYMNVSGVLDVSRAWASVPVVMSKPHFLDASPYVQNMVEGLSPNRDKHDTFIGVEPTTGIVMDGHSRLQPCMKIWPYTFEGRNKETWFPNIMPGIIIPQIWVEQAGTIPSNLAKDFKDSVYFAQDLSYYVYYIFSIVGSFVILLGAFIVYKFSFLTATETTKTERLIQEPF